MLETGETNVPSYTEEQTRTHLYFHRKNPHLNFGFELIINMSLLFSLSSNVPPYFYYISPSSFPVSPPLSALYSVSVLFSHTTLTVAVFVSDVCFMCRHLCHRRREIKAVDLTAIQRNGRRCGRRVHNKVCISPLDPCSGILATGKRRILKKL